MINSLRAHGAREPILVMDDGHTDDAIRARVAAAGAAMLDVAPVPVPDKVAKSLDEARHLPNFVRLRLLNLTEYDRVIFIDADMLAVNDVEPIRRLPCPAAVPQRMGVINAGLLVLCPSEKNAVKAMEKLQAADRRYPQAEQSFFSSFYWGQWHYASTCINARCYDYRPWLQAFVHRHMLFWPTRDICDYEDVVLLHFSSGHKPWGPHPEEAYAPELLHSYTDGRTKFLDHSP
eukprot:SM000359S13447  [mRNA]  locus=s359:6459:8452:+ [translate_table: standard]